ncbi:MAG: lipid A biosynthesis lauroyl acyltransferase, partial [Myxococcales bacterium]|nr:lipid A biosynthesis lauroyl acyltransferase [Myxococcales bacterium]
MRLLPQSTSLSFGAGLGRALGAVLGHRREIAMYNLRIAFPDWSEAERLRTLEASCRN